MSLFVVVSCYCLRRAFLGTVRLLPLQCAELLEALFVVHPVVIIRFCISVGARAGLGMGCILWVACIACRSSCVFIFVENLK